MKEMIKTTCYPKSPVKLFHAYPISWNMQTHKLILALFKHGELYESHRRFLELTRDILDRLRSTHRYTRETSGKRGKWRVEREGN